MGNNCSINYVNTFSINELRIMFRWYEKIIGYLLLCYVGYVIVCMILGTFDLI